MSDEQVSRDAEQLHLLVILNYICAALSLVGVPLFLVLIVVGVSLNNKPTGDPASDWLALALVLGGISGFVLSIANAFVNYYTARLLKERRRHTMLLVVAAVSCLNVPIGTAVSVFMLIVLCRPSVRAIFDQKN